MSNLYNASMYKNKIIDILLKNEDFVKLINPGKPPTDKILQKEVLLGGTFIIDGKKYEEQGYVFDYNFVDETTTEEKTFVFVEIPDIKIINKSTFTDFYFCICMFTGKKLVRISNNTIPTINDVEKMGYNVGYFGNRIDILCDVVDRCINGNEKIKGIGDIEPAEYEFCSMFCPGQKFYGKKLKYHVKNLNEKGEICGN